MPSQYRMQSAMEYLATHAYAIVILSGVIVVLFYIGIFSPQNSVGSSCVMNQNFGCAIPFLAQNGLLTIQITQTRYSFINVTGIGCSSNVSSEHIQIPPNPPTNQINIPSGSSYNFTVQCYTATGKFSGKIGTSFSGDIYLNYIDESTDFPYSAQGTLFTKVVN